MGVSSWAIAPSLRAWNQLVTLSLPGSYEAELFLFFPFAERASECQLAATSYL